MTETYRSSASFLSRSSRQVCLEKTTTQHKLFLTSPPSSVAKAKVFRTVVGEFRHASFPNTQNPHFQVWHHKDVFGKEMHRCMCGHLEPTFSHLMWKCTHTSGLVERCVARSVNRAEERERRLCGIVTFTTHVPFWSCTQNSGL